MLGVPSTGSPLAIRSSPTAHSSITPQTLQCCRSIHPFDGTVRSASGCRQAWLILRMGKAPTPRAACIPAHLATTAARLTCLALRAAASVPWATIVPKAPAYQCRARPDTTHPTLAAPHVRLAALATSAKCLEPWSVSHALVARSAVSPAPQPAIAVLQAATARWLVLRARA